MTLNAYWQLNLFLIWINPESHDQVCHKLIETMDNIGQDKHHPGLTKLKQKINSNRVWYLVYKYKTGDKHLCWFFFIITYLYNNQKETKVIHVLIALSISVLQSDCYKQYIYVRFSNVNEYKTYGNKLVSISGVQ